MSSESLSDVLRQMADVDETPEPTVDADTSEPELHEARVQGHPESEASDKATPKEEAPAEAPTLASSLAEIAAETNAESAVEAMPVGDENADDDDEAVAVAEADDEPANEDNPSAALAMALGAAIVGNEFENEETEAADEGPAFDVDTRPTTASGKDARRQRDARKRKKTSSIDMKAFFTPILITLGVLLMLPGVWSIMALTGAYELEAGDSAGKTIAWVMLVCWPIALFLLVSGIVFAFQVSRAKKAREQERAALGR